MARNSLTPEELASLESVSRGIVIPPAHQDKLIKLGLVDTRLGGLALTTEGTRVLREK